MTEELLEGRLRRDLADVASRVDTVDRLDEFSGAVTSLNALVRRSTRTSVLAAAAVVTLVVGGTVAWRSAGDTDAGLDVASEAPEPAAPTGSGEWCGVLAGEIIPGAGVVEVLTPFTADPDIILSLGPEAAEEHRAGVESAVREDPLVAAFRVRTPLDAVHSMEWMAPKPLTPDFEADVLGSTLTTYAVRLAPGTDSDATRAAADRWRSLPGVEEVTLRDEIEMPGPGSVYLLAATAKELAGSSPPRHRPDGRPYLAPDDLESAWRDWMVHLEEVERVVPPELAEEIAVLARHHRALGEELAAGGWTPDGRYETYAVHDSWDVEAIRSASLTVEAAAADTCGLKAPF